MKLLLVTFSLRNQNKDYNDFFVALRGNAIQWWHFIEQTCVVATEHDANKYGLLLSPHIETTDSLLVAEIKPHQFQGWLPQTAWDWLNKVSDVIQPTNMLTGTILPPPKLNS